MALSYVRSCLEDASPVRDTRTEVITFSSDTLAVGFVRHVDPDAFGTSGSTQWLPQLFGIFVADDQTCLSDAEALEYMSSYHNFADVFTASDVDLDRVYTLKQGREGYDEPVFFDLEAKRENGDVYFEPTPLVLESCHELFYDEDCLEKYK
jgi:hypothetical protein